MEAQRSNEMIQTPKQIAKLSGFLYLLPAPFAFFGMMYVSSNGVEHGGLGTTIKKNSSNETLFRLSMLCSFLMNINVILLGLVLYRMLQPEDKSMATFMMVFVIFGTCISMLSELYHFAVLTLSNTTSLLLFTPELSQYLVRLFLEMREYSSFGIEGIFWVLWLFPLGYLVNKSKFLPKFLGVLLIIAGIGYVLASFMRALAPNFDIPLIKYTSIGEMAFAIWLLIKGINVGKWRESIYEFS
ncbi:DUF4386 domain-containing protein [Xanthovirga aplysinae]|uniref:DUF4386 domain-containing protein n=1 Tax=Xanthovirga aplysinae TaxID=2529853 RepID=UPI0012BCA876|nr:DUF4386 domain-containing protein [Xanthovirga aplysinae]MTI30114.1 DUF4386 domain-containing protein [Xanthovirga aplysinae]